LDEATVRGFRGNWAIIPNGKHYTIVGTKRLPRKTKKFCTKILNQLQGTSVITSVKYFAHGSPNFDFTGGASRG